MSWAQGHFDVVVVGGGFVVMTVVPWDALPSRCSLNVALGCLMS